MHDLDVTSGQFSLVRHWQRKISEANLVLMCYKLPLSIFNINLNKYILMNLELKEIGSKLLLC